MTSKPWNSQYQYIRMLLIRWKVPLFKEVRFNSAGAGTFTIRVNNFFSANRFIRSATLNGKPLKRNWLIHEEIMKGGTLVIAQEQWISDINR